MIAFIDDDRDIRGSRADLSNVPIAPSIYHRHTAQRRDPNRRSPRKCRDEAVSQLIRRIFTEHFEVYRARKVWRQLRREGVRVARCTIERLMQTPGLQGVIRAKPVRTTISDKATPCPLDRVYGQCHAARPSAQWVSDFSDVSSGAGFVYVAFIIDVFARRIVGWTVSRAVRTDFVLAKPEQVLHDGRACAFAETKPLTPSLSQSDGELSCSAISATNERKKSTAPRATASTSRVACYVSNTKAIAVPS